MGIVIDLCISNCPVIPMFSAVIVYAFASVKKTLSTQTRKQLKTLDFNIYELA